MLFLCYFFYVRVTSVHVCVTKFVALPSCYTRPCVPTLQWLPCPVLRLCYGCVTRSSFSVTCHVHPSVNDSKTVLLTRKPDFPPLLFTELTFFYLFFSPFDWSCSASTCPTGRPILQLTCEFEVDVFVSLSDKIKNNWLIPYCLKQKQKRTRVENSL